MLEYIESYLGSTLTPGQAGNQMWALVYIFIIFAGISVAVMAMNWLERKALAHMDRFERDRRDGQRCWLGDSRLRYSLQLVG